MSFVSENRKNIIQNKDNNMRNQNISVENRTTLPYIHPKIVHRNKKFTEEIPKQFKYNNFRGKLKFWNKASRDRWNWDKIPKDAKNLDSKFDCTNRERKITPAADRASEKLKNDSIAYLDRNKSRMKEDDRYTINDSDEDIIISKRALIAAKMINKITRNVEDGGLLSSLDGRGDYIKEGAKNVNLLPTATFQYSVKGETIPEKERYKAKVKFKDCRKEKLFDHEPKAQDCRQSGIGDCWLQTVLIDILNKKGPQPIKEMLKDDGASGNVKVRLFKPEKVNGIINSSRNYVPRIYTVPKRIPVLDNRYIYNKGANWVHYVEAAVAKSGIRDKYFKENYTKKDVSGNKFRDYSSIEGGNAYLGWPMILGNITASDFKVAKSKDGANALYNKVECALSNPNDKKLIYMSFEKFPESDGKGQSAGEEMKRGLVAGHAYSVCGYEEEGGVKYIRLINPWSSRTGRDYGKDGKNKGREKSFESVGDESFRCKVSTVVKYLKNFYIEG